MKESVWIAEEILLRIMKRKSRWTEEELIGYGGLFLLMKDWLTNWISKGDSGKPLMSLQRGLINNV